MKTIQGQDYNYSDVLLYKPRNESDIVVFVDKPEQLLKFEKTGSITDAPVGIIPYSTDELTKILTNMRNIKNFDITQTGKVVVEYTDGKTVTFAANNESIVKDVMEAQRDFSMKNNWTNIQMTPEKKEAAKNSSNKNLRRTLAGILAAIAIAGGYAHYKNGIFPFNSKDNDGTEEEPRLSGVTDVQKSNFEESGKALYNEINSKDTYILKYQQISQIHWDEQLATEIVEIVNGVYPTTMSYMSDENAKAEMSEALQAIELLIASNLNPEVSENDIVDLSQYVTTTKEKVLINNTHVLARNVVDESIGEPMNGQLLLSDEDLVAAGLNPCNPEDAEFINSEYMKFGRQFLNSVDEILNYEYDTINDADYLSMNAGARFIVAAYFQSVNGIIPQWSYITRDSSEQTSRTNDVYYRYFMDDVEKRLYLPREGKNGTVEYYYDYYDSNNACHEEVYSLDTMFAMAGMSITEEDRNLNITPNPNIHIKGIGPEVENRLEEDMDELENMKDTVYVK